MNSMLLAKGMSNMQEMYEESLPLSLPPSPCPLPQFIFGALQTVNF